MPQRPCVTANRIVPLSANAVTALRTLQQGAGSGLLGFGWLTVDTTGCILSSAERVNAHCCIAQRWHCLALFG